ncbi:MAG: type II toxin-antitoxin system VapC family toxin [Pseudomonadota bacterium]
MSFLLDTNVVSELRKAAKAHAQVMAWARRVPAYSQYISVITLHELELGVLLMERRDRAQGKPLRSWLTDQVLPAFAGRVLSIDAETAQTAAQLHVPNPKPVRDAFIAATALIHGMTVVTRNVADFADTGVKLLDPWR